MGEVTPEPPLIWRYDGKWQKVPEPFDAEDATSREEALQNGGWLATPHHWGPAPVSAVEIHAHSSDPERWLLDFAPADGLVYTIEVVWLPHLIELLSRLAPIAVADLAAATYGLPE